MIAPNYSDDLSRVSQTNARLDQNVFTVNVFDGPVQQWDTLELWVRVNSTTSGYPAYPMITVDVYSIDQRQDNFLSSIVDFESYGIPFLGTSPEWVPLYIPIRARYLSISLYGYNFVQTDPFTANVDYYVNFSRRTLVPPSHMNHYSPLFGTSGGGAVFTPAGVGTTFFRPNYAYHGLVWVSGFVLQPTVGANNLLIIGERDNAGSMKRKRVIQRAGAIGIPQEFSFVMPYHGREGVLQFTNFAGAAGTDWEVYVYPYGGSRTR